MADGPRRMRRDEYDRYVDIAASARDARDLARLRAEVLTSYADDPTAQLLAEVLYDQEQSLEWGDGARAQTAAVWHEDPTLQPPRRSPRSFGASELNVPAARTTERRA